MIMNRNESIKQADSLISSIRKALNYQVFMTPNNYKNENLVFVDLFKRGKKYNPQYKYKQFNPAGINSQWNTLKFFENDGTGISEIIYKNIVSLNNEIVLYTNIGKSEVFTDASKLVYGIPDRLLIDKAIKELNDEQQTEENSLIYNADYLASVFSDRLNKYGFNWSIVIQENMAPRVSVEPEFNTIYINKNASFTKNDLIRLQVHEIDTHVLRTENGRRHGINVLSGDSPITLKDEEGLALFNEYINKVQDDYSLKLYAARFLCCCNIDMSFYDMFDMLISYGCTFELALYVVSRIKRGLTDTSRPGGFNKDYVYFQGLHEMISALADNENTYKQLYFGAIALEDIPMLSKEIDVSINRIKYPLPIMQSDYPPDKIE